MNLEVFSDTVCPWCWIGKRRLEKALALPGCEDVTVTWRAAHRSARVASEYTSREPGAGTRCRWAQRERFCGA